MTPYRDAPGPSFCRALLCATCGKRIVFADEEITCPHCGVRESGARDDLALRGAIRIQSIIEGGYDELLPIAESLGETRKCAAMTLECDGHPCTISLEINSGTAHGLSFSSTTEGFPAITFRAEDDSDAQAKADGIAREVQTGDEDFDKAVYVESDSADVDVLSPLAAPAVRNALIDVLTRVGSVRFSAEGVSFLDAERDLCFDEARVRRNIIALRVLAGAPRTTAQARAERRSLARVSLSLLWLALPLGIALILHGGRSYPPVEAGNLVGRGGLIAFVAAVALQPLLKRAVRGRSTSHGQLALLRVASLLGFPFLGVGLALTLNGALDRSAAFTEEGTVIHVEDDHDGGFAVTVWTPNRIAHVNVSSSVKEGQPARLWLRRGAFGEAWKLREIEVLRPPMVSAIDELP